MEILWFPSSMERASRQHGNPMRFTKRLKTYGRCAGLPRLGGGGAGWGDNPGPALGRRLSIDPVDFSTKLRVLRLHVRTVNSLSMIHRSLRRDIRVTGSHRVVIHEFSTRLSLVQQRAYGNYRNRKINELHPPEFRPDFEEHAPSSQRHERIHQVRAEHCVRKKRCGAGIGKEDLLRGRRDRIPDPLCLTFPG